MYGSSAFFGVVNIVTLEGEALDGLRLSSEAGSFETLGVQGDYGKRCDNGIDVLAPASGFDREGQALYFSEFDDPETNYGWAEDSDKEHAERYFLQATSGGFSLQAASSSREKRIPTAPWETVFNDPRTSTVDRWDVLSLEYSRAAEEDRFGFLGRISHNRYDYTGDYLYDYGEDDEPYLVVNKDSASGRWWGAEFELVRRYKDGRIFIAGAEYRDNFRQNQKNEDEEVYTDESRSSHSLGLFVHAELPLTDKLKLSAGLRHDGGDQTEDSLSPKAALIWAPAEDRALKLLYGRAFRSPNAYELYFDEVETLEEPLPGSQKRPLDLFAEEITTEELVWEQRVGSHWRGLLSLYHYEINDLISLTTDPADGLLVFDNLGRVEARGVEAEVEGWWRGGLRTRWSYAYQEAEAAGAGRRLSNSPRHVTKMQLRRWFWDERLQAATDIRHSSGRLTPGDQLVTAHTVANLSLTARLPHDRLGMTLSFYNLFAERYADPGSEEHLQEQLQQDGRSWRLSLTYRP
jgi:iron complex outermembrane receptor protein